VINAIIRASLENRAVVLLVAAMLTATGVYSYLRTPVDAIARPVGRAGDRAHALPGPGAAVVEDQVTYPLTTALLSVPGATAVRGYSFFGDSFVNVLFEDGTDPVLGAFARARVPEPGHGAAAGGRPAGARPRRDRRRLGLPIRARRSQRAARPRAAALDAGLVPEVRAAGAARRGRGGDDRRHGAQYQVVVDPLRLRATALR
jgi:copper/silver efflux system protein